MSAFIQKQKLSSWVIQDWVEIPNEREIRDMLMKLPDRPGLYAICHAGEFIYIGMSGVSLLKRWKSHHKTSNLKIIQRMRSHFTLYYWTLPNIDQMYDPNRIKEQKKFLLQVEKEMIKLLNPVLNGVDK